MQRPASNGLSNGVRNGASKQQGPQATAVASTIKRLQVANIGEDAPNILRNILQQNGVNNSIVIKTFKQASTAVTFGQDNSGIFVEVDNAADITGDNVAALLNELDQATTGASKSVYELVPAAEGQQPTITLPENYAKASHSPLGILASTANA